MGDTWIAPETAIVADAGALERDEQRQVEPQDAADAAPDLAVATPDVAAVVQDVAPDAAREVAALGAVVDTWLASAIAVVDGRLSFDGLPGVSADGMHLALVDVAGGRVAIDVARLDGKVLVDKVLQEAREHDVDPTTLQRRFRARIAQAHKVLAKAGMHALTKTTFVVGGGDYVVQVPGANPVTVAKAALDLPCGRATGIDAAFVDREHGLVVMSVVRDGNCATDKTRHDWHVVTIDRRLEALEPRPADEVP